MIVIVVWPPHGRSPFLSLDRPEAVYGRYPQRHGYVVVPVWIGGAR